MSVPADEAIRSSRQQTPATVCPLCGGKGKAVKPITILSLLTEEAKALASTSEGFRFCFTPSCDVAYFHPTNGERFLRRDVRLPIGLKEKESPRSVCYCFNHSVEEIEAEVATTGTSRIPADIADKCRRGLDSCEERNPKGSCCLSDVSRVLKEALRRKSEGRSSSDAATEPAQTNCCKESEEKRS